MNSLKKIILYFPSLIFGFFNGITINLYKRKILRPKKYNTKIISIGNLIMGGAGKTPTVEYLANYFIKKNIYFAIISRGYRRETKGMVVASENDNFKSIGDEPAQYFKKFSEYSKIIVSEDREVALSFCDKNKIKYVILDDAFQNLKFDKDLNVLVSSFYKPFFYDDLFPMGMLRESKNNAKRADLLIYSNCPDKISSEKVNRFKTKSKYYLREGTPILFSTVKYQKPVKIFGKSLKKDVIVISSIAYPELFHKYISSKYNIIEIIKFKDHHKYSDYDIKKISTKLNDDVSLVTTEKDAVKLCEYGELLSSYNVYYVPISIDFLFDDFLLKRLEKL